MSDERQAFEQTYSIPTGAEWCEKRDIYIHKNYSGLVLHPINESWEAFCEGALWQASREALEGEPDDRISVHEYTARIALQALEEYAENLSIVAGWDYEPLEHHYAQQAIEDIQDKLTEQEKGHE